MISIVAKICESAMFRLWISVSYSDHLFPASVTFAVAMSTVTENASSLLDMFDRRVFLRPAAGFVTGFQSNLPLNTTLKTFNHVK